MVPVEVASTMITGQGVITYVSPVGLATRINILISKIVFDHSSEAIVHLIYRGTKDKTGALPP